MKHKSMKEQTARAVCIVFTIGAICIAWSTMSGCARGYTGATGAAGPQGSPGADGSNCTVTTVVASDSGAGEVAPNGGSLIQCQDGTQSLVLNGTNGTNGTIIQPIQLCATNPAGSYSSGTFPEVGFCIQNNLYGVYSTNGGFMTEIFPGPWSSDGVNSSCNFTVGPTIVDGTTVDNCNVTQN